MVLCVCWVLNLLILQCHQIYGLLDHILSANSPWGLQKWPLLLWFFPFSLDCYGQPASDKGRYMVNIKKSSEWSCWNLLYWKLKPFHFFFIVVFVQLIIVRAIVWKNMEFSGYNWYWFFFWTSAIEWMYRGRLLVRLPVHDNPWDIKDVRGGVIGVHGFHSSFCDLSNEGWLVS